MFLSRIFFTTTALITVVLTALLLPYTAHAQGGTTSTQIFYIQTDELGTPRAIIDTQGRIRWTHTNDEPFGSMPPNQNPSNLGNFDFPLRKRGQYYDKETGLIYNGARYYDPQTGRFTQPDPLGLKDGTNPYAYVHNNPMIAIDPFGLETIVVINNNGVAGTHVGMLVGGELIDPAGDYMKDRNTQCRCDHRATLDDYLQYQKADGPEVLVYRYNTTPQEEEEILRRDANAPDTFPGLCATKTQNLLSGVGPFKKLSTTYFSTPAVLNYRLKRLGLSNQ